MQFPLIDTKTPIKILKRRHSLLSLSRKFVIHSLSLILSLSHTRGACQLCKQSTCHRDGRVASARENLHLEEAVALPELDRHQHEGVQPGRVPAARDRRVPQPRVFPARQREGDGHPAALRRDGTGGRVPVAGERRGGGGEWAGLGCWLGFVWVGD